MEARIKVLGTPYDVLFQTPDENPKLVEAEGLCELYTHKIIVDVSGSNDAMAFDKADEYYHKTLRHEAFHALFAESGLTHYTEDEVLVEFLAAQYPKIRKLMDKVDRIPLPEVQDV